VPEVVAHSDANDRFTRQPRIERFLRQAVRASVVRHLEQLGRPKQPLLGHTLLRRLLGIAGQQIPHRSRRDLEHHACVVRFELARWLLGRPEHPHRRSTDPP
jgi:hypothetical protein